MAIGKRIKEARLKKSLTQEELAKIVGVTKGAIANYENNTSHPKEPVMYALIDALDVDANFLFQDFVKTTNTPIVLSDSAQKLARDYDSLDAHGQHIVRLVADEELQRMEMESTARKEREAMEAGMLAPPAPTPPIASQPYPELDLTAQVAKLERQNQELAAEIAAMREQERKAPQEMTDEELHAELDRQLLEEKIRAENGVASGPTNSDTATG